MGVALSKFEKTLVFGGFIAVAGVLVGSAYVVSTFRWSGDNAVVADSTEGPPSPVVDPAMASVQPAATQLASVLTLVAVPTAAELPPVATSPMDWRAIEIVSPTTQPATQPVMAVAAATPPARPAALVIDLPNTKPATLVIAAPATKPADAHPTSVVQTPPPAPIKPYAIKLPVNRVTHMYASETGSQPTWYELKLEAPQMAELTAAANAIATADHCDADEYDHLAVMWPRPELTLLWWRPAELIDPDLLVIAGPAGTELWIAMSRRTGRTFLYASKPVDFTAAR